MADAVGRHEIGVGRASRDFVEHRLGFPSVAVAVGTGAQDGFGMEPNFEERGEEVSRMRQRLFVRFQSTAAQRLRSRLHTTPVQLFSSLDWR